MRATRAPLCLAERCYRYGLVPAALAGALGGRGGVLLDHLARVARQAAIDLIPVARLDAENNTMPTLGRFAILSLCHTGSFLV